MEPEEEPEDKRSTRADMVLGAIAVAGTSLAVLLWAMQPEDWTRRITASEQGADPAVFRPLDGTTAPPTARGGTAYVPVYSTLYLGDRLLQAGLAVTLGLHNVSPAHDLVVLRIDYHDTAGRLLRRLVDRPHAIPPMATAEFRIDRDDPSGGSGANHLMEWAAPAGGSEPLVEAVMVGRAGSLGLSLVGRGVSVGSTGTPPPASSRIGPRDVRSQAMAVHRRCPGGGGRHGAVGIGNALPGPRPPPPAARAEMTVRKRVKPARPDRVIGEGRADNARSTLGLIARVVAGCAGLAVLAGLIALGIAAVFGWRPP